MCAIFSVHVYVVTSFIATPSGNQFCHLSETSKLFSVHSITGLNKKPSCSLGGADCTGCHWSWITDLEGHPRSM